MVFDLCALDILAGGFSGHRHRIQVQQFFLRQLVHNRRYAPRGIQFFDEVVARRGQLAQMCIRDRIYSIRPNFISSPFLSYFFRFPVISPIEIFHTAVRNKLLSIA